MSVRVHQVNVWSDPAVGPSGPVPMPNSLLFLPDGYTVGQPTPAALIASRWGGYPYDPLPVAVGEALAARGIAILSLGARRRGAEGQLTSSPDDDLRDIKLGVDYLATNGFTDIHLVGEEIGALSVTRYAAKTRDSRVRGIALLRPIADLTAWLRDQMGETAYHRQVRHSTVAARQGSGMDDRVDIALAGPDGRRVLIDQYSAIWLQWWSPTADTRLTRHLGDVLAPILILDRDEARAAALVAAAHLSRDARAQHATDTHAQVTTLGDWILERAAPIGPTVTNELWATTTANGERLVALWYTADACAGADTALLYVPGMTATPLGVFAKQGAFLAQHGLPTLVIGLRRSGRGGHRSATLDMDREDIDAFVTLLQRRGVRRVVLAGGSLGAIACSRYQVIQRNPAIVALALFAPTADTADWARRGMGDEIYHHTVRRAETAIAEGRDDTVIEPVFRRPDPCPFHPIWRYPEEATAWISRWGPDADTRHLEFLRQVDVPLLLLCGSEDNYNDRARMDALEAAATRAPSVAQQWYEDCDHLFVGFERQAAADVLAWLRATRVLPQPIGS